MLSGVQALRHLLLLEQRSIHPVTHSFCNNWQSRPTFKPLLGNSLTKCLPLWAFKSNKLLMRILPSSVFGMFANNLQ